MCSNSEENDTKKVSEYLDKVELVRLFRRGDLDLEAVVKRISEAPPESDLLQMRPNGGSLLHSFSILGVYEAVECLLKKGLKPTMIQCKGDISPLQCSLKIIGEKRDSERAKILKLYLSLKDYSSILSVNHQSTQGWTALTAAVCMNLEKCVEVLLDHRADTTVIDPCGTTILHKAIGNPGIVKMLLAADSGNINTQNGEGDTALSLALKRGDVESIMILLEYNADPNIPNKDGIAPLFLAAKMGHLEMVQALFKCGSSVNAQGGEQGITPLHWAAHTLKEEVALYLIEKGANVVAQDKEGRSPLSMATPELAAKMKDAARRHHPQCNLPCSLSAITPEQKAVEACCSGNVQMLCTVLHAGVDVNFTSGSTNASLLHMAAYHGQLPVIMHLFHRGANIQAVDSEGDTLLHFACMKNFKHGRHIETLRILASCLLPHPNKQNRAGDTPLIVALKNCFPCRAKILVWSKADISIANGAGELPLHIVAQDLRNIEVLFHLVERCTNLDPRDHQGMIPLMYAVKANCNAAVKYLLQRGVEPNQKDEQGHTPLLMAVQESNIGTCLLLLEAGADPNIAATAGPKITPLHAAVCRNATPLCKVLLEYGADPMAQDSDGHTPLSIANPVLKKALTLLLKIRKDVESDLREGPPRSDAGVDSCTARLLAMVVPPDGSCPMPCNDTGCGGAGETPYGGAGCVPCNEPTASLTCNGGRLATPTPFDGCSSAAMPDSTSRSSSGGDYTESYREAPCHISSPTSHATPPSTNGCHACVSGVQRSNEQSNERSHEQGQSVISGDEMRAQSLLSGEVGGQSSLSGGVINEKEASQRSVADYSTSEMLVQSSGDDVTAKVKGKMERKGTFSKVEEGKEEEDRYLQVQAELAILTMMVVKQREELESLTQANALLLSKNQSLTDHTNKNRKLLVAHHLDDALSLSMHALTNGLIYAQDKLRHEEPSHEVRLDRVLEYPCPISAGVIDKKPGRKRETGQVGGCGGSGAKEGCVARPLMEYNPLNTGSLQWWMVDSSAVEMDKITLNASSAPSEKFFDVHHGTFRQMDVVVRVIRDVEKWSYGQYMTFFHEVNCLSCLHCPHVVQFLGACFDPASKTCSIVNEYMSHGSLHSVLHKERIPLEWGTRVSMMLDVIRGLAFLHSHHMLHRCLTPTNILIGEHFTAKLTDYGLYETKSKSGYFKKCDPVYVAPEALQSFQFTLATDVYSFAIVMYECAAGKKVFADLTSNTVCIVMRLVNGSRPTFPEGVATAYKALVEKCWTGDPDFRPTSELVVAELSEIPRTT